MTQDFCVLLETALPLRSYIWTFALWLLPSALSHPTKEREPKAAQPCSYRLGVANLGYKYPAPSLYLVRVPL